jgi:hypothetical protein
LVEVAEDFAALAVRAASTPIRPSTTTRGRAFYIALGFMEAYMMPRFYSEELDGITFQKFFD